MGKPGGLWLSCDEEWMAWSTDADFNLEGLAYSHPIILLPFAKILRLASVEAILAFTKKYLAPYQSPLPSLYTSTYKIDWAPVKVLYQGIIIAPYQWGCRLNMETSWYYGWDCASGCIWDLAAVESFGPAIPTGIAAKALHLV
jgi:hypothetical protein